MKKKDQVVPLGMKTPVNFGPHNLFPVYCIAELEEGKICGCPFFEPAITIAYTPATGSPTGKEVIHKLPVQLCKWCGNPVQPETIQASMKRKEEKNEQENAKKDREA